MSNLPQFAAYAAAFEETLLDDNWARLEQYFATNAIHFPGDGTEAHGREASVAALKDSVESLERNCDSRELMGEPEITETDNIVKLGYKIKYTKTGLPDFHLVGTETIEYSDGLIERIEDVFDDLPALEQWREEIAR